MSHGTRRWEKVSRREQSALKKGGKSEIYEPAGHLQVSKLCELAFT